VVVQSALMANAPHRWLPRLRRRHGDVFSIRIMPGRRVVMLADAEHIRAVFAGPADVFHAGDANELIRAVVGDRSVMVLDEDEHLRMRRLLMPAFNGAALRGYRGMFDQYAGDEVAGWPVGRPVRLLERMEAHTISIILRVVLGITDQARFDRLHRLMGTVVDTGFVQMLAWMYRGLERYQPWRRMRGMQDQVDELLFAEIGERRSVPDLADRDDVLSRLISGGKGDNDVLTDAELRDQLISLVRAGFETTAGALTWVFHELARRPEQLAAAQRAADEGDDDYLEAVVKETLRLRPVLYQVARLLTEPAEVGGHLLPADVLVVPCVGLVHQQATYHPSPGDFQPERFIGGNPVSGSWIPFGGGVRRCPGASFGLMEATSVLRAVLTRFDVRPVRPRPEAPKARNVTLVPGRGGQDVLSPRSG
jgi:cytochrome P450